MSPVDAVHLRRPIARQWLYFAESAFTYRLRRVSAVPAVALICAHVAHVYLRGAMTLRHFRRPPAAISIAMHKLKTLDMYG
jgi:hypothetical protein